MDQRKRDFIRPLLLILTLVLGPVQAQIVLACPVMDTVMQNGCLHDDHDSSEECTNTVPGAAAESGDDPCCEQLVKISSDEDTGQAVPIVKPAEVHPPGAGHPQAIFTSFYIVEPPQPLELTGADQRAPSTVWSDSDTYLITQRLRI
jgi:hypothetical protein